MTQAKHTPGLWHVKRADDALNCWEVCEDRKPGFCIADGLTLEDAHLIAAAPELLEALEEAWLTIRAWEGMGNHDAAIRKSSWENYQHSPEMKKINNAIAKARGQI